MCEIMVVAKESIAIPVRTQHGDEFPAADDGLVVRFHDVALQNNNGPDQYLISKPKNTHHRVAMSRILILISPIDQQTR